MSLNIASLKIAAPKILEIFLGVSLLAICSQITIPLEPVPITLQTVAVMFIGLTYNRINAVSSILCYLTLGCLGIPIFKNFSFGINTIIGPTGGYLVGFLIAVYVMSKIKEFRANNYILNNIFLCLVGNVIIMGLGYLWLAQFIGVSQAFMVGVLPFIIPGIIKSLLLVGFIRAVKL